MLMLIRKYTILSVVYVWCMCVQCVQVYICMCMLSMCVWFKWLHASKYMEVREGCWMSSSVPFCLIDEIASLAEREIHISVGWPVRSQYLSLSPRAGATAGKDKASFLHRSWRFELTFSCLQRRGPYSLSYLSSPKKYFYGFLIKGFFFHHKEWQVRCWYKTRIQLFALEWDRFWRISVYAHKNQ